MRGSGAVRCEMFSRGSGTKWHERNEGSKSEKFHWSEKSHSRGVWCGSGNFVRKRKEKRTLNTPVFSDFGGSV